MGRPKKSWPRSKWGSDQDLPATAAAARAFLRDTSPGGYFAQDPDQDQRDGGIVKEAPVSQQSSLGPTAKRKSKTAESRGTSRERGLVFGTIILDEIGNSFADLREKGGRSEAWAHLQSRMMRNLGLISPIVAMDTVVSLALKIEDFLKSEQATGKAPGDLFAEWLNGPEEVKQ